MENSTNQTKKPFYKSAWFITLSILLAIILVAIIIFAAVNAGGGNNLNWSELELGNKLPKPKKLDGEILSDNSEYLSLEMNNVSEEDFNDYMKECKNAGYNVDIAYESLGSMYEAFNEEGYNLYLSYYSSEKTMHINLSEPATVKMKDFEWPDNDLCSLLPAPKSNFGYFNSNSSSYLSVSIGNTSVQDFEDYVEACQDSGFNVDYYSSDNSYSAKNSDGYSLYVKYAGVNVMEITLNKPYEDTDDDTTIDESSPTEEEPEESKEPEKEPVSSKPEDSSSSEDGLSTEFKNAMDSYEEFMDDYIDFMEKYQNSDGTDLSLITEYTEYMNKYAQVCEDFEAWDSKDMNSTEAAYYLEVQTRVNQKLLNALD